MKLNAMYIPKEWGGGHGYFKTLSIFFRRELYISYSRRVNFLTLNIPPPHKNYYKAKYIISKRSDGQFDYHRASLFKAEQNYQRTECNNSFIY